MPQKGPQIAALQSRAFITGYGGQAGGGKTDLLLGAAITQHRRSIIFRRESEQLDGAGGIINRAKEILVDGPGIRWSGKACFFPVDRALEFGGVKDPDSWKAHAGKPHDFIGFDEAVLFLELQVRALIAWCRTSFPGQRTRVVMAFNPPTAPEQEWIIKFFGPWLDKNHDKPAADGEIRWFAMIDGDEKEVASGEPFEHTTKTGATETILPLSRTFFRARLEDNAYYMADASYAATLASLPEPLRSLLRYGRFDVAQEDHPWQVIPTAWVVAAQERWKAMVRPAGPLDAVGLDVARGGQDKTVYTPRYANYFDKQVVKPGRATKDGQTVIRDVLEIENVTSAVPIKVDSIGVGSSPTDIGDMFDLNIVPMNGSNKSGYVAGRKDATEQGTLRMVNKRAEWAWRLREALDPTSGEDLAIPPDPELRADLCAIRWKMMSRGVQIEAKDDIKARLGRSPDKGESLIYAHAEEGTDVALAVPIVISRPRTVPG